MTTTTIATTLTTSDLFDATNNALCDRRWDDATVLVRELSRRDDNAYMLCDAGSTASKAPAPKPSPT